MASTRPALRSVSSTSSPSTSKPSTALTRLASGTPRLSSKVFFGEGIEAGIDLKGRVFVWPKVKLPASAEPTQNFNRREGVVLLDEETNNKQIAFTKVDTRSRRNFYGCSKRTAASSSSRWSSRETR